MKERNDRRTHVAVLGIKALPAFAGADRVVEHVLQRFSDSNDYTVYLLRKGSEAMSCEANRHYVYVPALKGKYLRAPSYFLLCCAHYVVKGRYDVAHVHNSDFGLFCVLLKLKRKVRIVGTFHGDPATREKWNWAAKAFLRISEAAFVRVCDSLTSVSAEKDVPGKTVRHIPNGIEAREPSSLSGQQLQPLPAPSGRYVMFACGRLDRTKGLHHLLAAYRAIDGDAALLVVGDFSHDSRYSRDIEAAAAQDERVILHRSLLDESSLIDALRGSSAFVFPSEVEGMSMMLLEAVMFAKVVVCSDIAANLAVVGDDYRFSFRSGDSDALRSALAEALAASKQDWDPRPLRERVGRTFCWERIAEQYEALYRIEPEAVAA